MSRREFAVLTRTHLVVEAGKIVDRTESFEVRVMARSEGYAMVRRERAIPFVCRERELSQLAASKEQRGG